MSVFDDLRNAMRRSKQHKRSDKHCNLGKSIQCTGNTREPNGGQMAMGSGVDRCASCIGMAPLHSSVWFPHRRDGQRHTHRLAHACHPHATRPRHASVCTKHRAVRLSTSTRPSMSPMPRRRWMNGRVANGSNASKCSPVPARADFSNSPGRALARPGVRKSALRAPH